MTRPASSATPSGAPRSAARTPAAHSTVADAIRLAAERPPSAVTSVTRRRPHLHAERFEIAHGAAASSVEARQDARPRLDQDHARLPRVDAAEVPRQREATHLADRAGQLHAGRAAADDHECQMRRRVFGFGSRSAARTPQHATANLGRLRQRLEPGRIRFPRFVAEVRVLGAAGEQQIVVWELADVGADAALGDIDACAAP